MQHSAQFQQLTDLDPVLSEIFDQTMRQVPMLLVNQVIGRRVSSKAKETHLRIGSFSDPEEFQGQVAYDTADKDHEIEYVHKHYTLGFKVEVTLAEDLQYDGIFDSTNKLSQSFARKRVKDEASLFNNAFSGVLGYDGKVLCATDHPRSRTDTTAVSNLLGTKALSDQNLEQAIVQLENLGDDRGETTGAMATHLIVGRANRQKALQLVGSTQTPEDGNNAINTHSGLSVIVHPMISGNKWFVVDGPMALMTARWFDRLLPEFGSTYDAGKTLTYSYFGRMRYSLGWSDFRWVVGSNPA